MANSLKQFQDWMVFSGVTRKVFRLLYPMNHLNCGRNDRTIPPLKPIPMVFFLLVYASSAMLCENDGDGGGRGGGGGCQ